MGRRLIAPRTLTTTPPHSLFMIKHFSVLPLLATPALLLVASQIIVHAEGDVPAPTDKVKIEQVVTNGFTHPGIGLTKEALDRARAQVLAGKEPWATYYREMAQSANAARDVKCRNESPERPGQPDIDAFDSRSIQARLDQDGARAQTQALMYFFTGDDVYRANALRIIRVWASMDPAKCQYYTDAHIHSGYPLKSLLSAAEILRYTTTDNPGLKWTEEDTKRLTNNLINPMISKLMDSNGWFMNQNNFAIHGAMAGFIFTNNRAGYDQRVEWFTINKDAPNPGWDGSIKQLARLVEKNDLTGEKVDKPQVQLVELGRDGAHAAEDINLFVNISKMMMAQGTKVDPVTGTPSSAENAVGPLEFLNDRILTVANFASRYMLGYDTEWIPVGYDISRDGTVNRIYPRLSDQYRGRMTTFGSFWDLYFYYKYKRGIDIAKAAPYFYDAFQKRITTLDWLNLPIEAEQEGASLLLPPVTPGVVPLARRVTILDPSVTIASDETGKFVRTSPGEKGSRFAILSGATDGRTIGLRVRSTGPAQITMQGFANPWNIPDTKGEWKYITYDLGTFEKFDNIAFLTVRAAPGVTVDFADLLQEIPETTSPQRFANPEPILREIAYKGAPITLDFAAASPTSPGSTTSYHLENGPTGATLDAKTGAFTWTPEAAGTQAFQVVLSDGPSMASKQAVLDILTDFPTAVAELKKGYDPSTLYVTASRERYETALAAVGQLPEDADGTKRFETFMALQKAVQELEPATPRMADGSLDFVKTATSPDAGKSISLLADGNDDTFPLFSLARDGNYTFDFGPDFRVSVDAFSLEGRLNFEERAEGTAFFGSNDGIEWTRLTSGQTPLSTGMVRIEVDPERRGERYRFLRMQKLTQGLYEPSELRIHGTRQEIDNQIASLTMSSPTSKQNRIVVDDTVRLDIKGREDIKNLRVTIQGIDATITPAGEHAFRAEARMSREAASLGPVRFRVDYDRADGSHADTVFLTTDGSRLLLSDDSNIIPDLPGKARILDPESGQPAPAARTLFKTLLDGRPDTFTDIRIRDNGSGSYLLLDFGPSKKVKLSRAELLPRQDRYASRITGTVVEGSDDKENWTTLTPPAVNTADWQSLPVKGNRSFRYLRVFNPTQWYGNMAELRLHGTVD